MKGPDQGAMSQCSLGNRFGNRIGNGWGRRDNRSWATLDIKRKGFDTVGFDKVDKLDNATVKHPFVGSDHGLNFGVFCCCPSDPLTSGRKETSPRHH